MFKLAFLGDDFCRWVQKWVQWSNRSCQKSLYVIDFMAPEVGLEPTTLRLTASEFPSPSAAIDDDKSLYINA
jgi:hypothetical protein